MYRFLVSSVSVGDDDPHLSTLYKGTGFMLLRNWFSGEVRLTLYLWFNNHGVTAVVAN